VDGGDKSVKGVFIGKVEKNNASGTGVDWGELAFIWGRIWRR
jgi:hypothetical protein